MPGEIVSKEEWESYVNKMFPVQTLEGEDLKLLQAELDSDFYMDPDKPNDDEEMDDVCDSHDFVTDNVLKFAKHVGGMKWINALHSFDGSNDNYQHMPLTYILSRECDNWQTVQLLVQYGADINIRDTMGRPPLYHAVMGGMPRWHVVDILLDAGANGMAIYKGRPLAALIKELADGKHKHQASYSAMSPPMVMIWETIRDKYKLWHWDSKKGGSDEDGHQDDSSMSNKECTQAGQKRPHDEA